MADVIVVGGGPAGAALATFLSRRSISVQLFERERFPRDKPCGEGLLPAGVDVLRKLGLEERVRGRPFKGICYHVAGKRLRACFSGNAAAAHASKYGLGQRRLHFDAALWQASASAPAVSAHQGVRVDAPLVEHERVVGVIVEGQPVRARWVVGADGSSSTLRRALGLEQKLHPWRVGIRTHFALPAGRPELDEVHVFVRQGYELYITPLPDSQLLVAALAHRDAIGDNLRRTFWRWLEREPSLQTLLEGAQQMTELSGRAPLLRTAGGQRRRAGLVLLGDASTSVDPITAGGMSLALVSADILAEHLPAMLRGSRLAAQRFERERASAVRTHQLLGSGLLWLGQRPVMARRACAALQAYPPLLQVLLGIASGKPSS